MTEAKLAALTEKFYDAIDSNRFDDMHAMLSEDAVMVYANFPPINGRDAIKGLFNSVSGTRKSAKHFDYKYWVKSENDWMISCQFEQILYDPKKAEKNVTLPAAVHFTTNAEGKLNLYHIFMDPTPGTIALGKSIVPDEKYNPKVQ